jgi:hypothetical protein
MTLYKQRNCDARHAKSWIRIIITQLRMFLSTRRNHRVNPVHFPYHPQTHGPQAARTKITGPQRRYLRDHRRLATPAESCPLPIQVLPRTLDHLSPVSPASKVRLYCISLAPIINSILDGKKLSHAPGYGPSFQLPIDSSSVGGGAPEQNPTHLYYLGVRVAPYRGHANMSMLPPDMPDWVIPAAQSLNKSLSVISYFDSSHC